MAASGPAARAHPVTAGITVATADTPGIARRRERTIAIASDSTLVESRTIDAVVHCQCIMEPLYSRRGVGEAKAE